MTQDMFFQYTGIFTWCIIAAILFIGVLRVIPILWELFMEWNRETPTAIYQVAEFLTLWFRYELRKGKIALDNKSTRWFWLHNIIGPINKQNRFQWSRNYWAKLVKMARKQRLMGVNKNAT